MTLQTLAVLGGIRLVPGTRALGVFSRQAGFTTANLGTDRSQVVAGLVTSSDLSAFADLASTPESLVDALDVTFLGGAMSSSLKQTSRVQRKPAEI